MNCIKYFRTFGSNPFQRNYIINRKIIRHLKHQFCRCNSAVNALQELKEEDNFWSKVIYNEVVHKIKVKRKPRNNSNTSPIFLKFLLEEDNKVNRFAVENNETEGKSEPLNFPYEIKIQSLKKFEESDDLKKAFPKSVYNFTPSDTKKIQALEWGSDIVRLDFRNIENPNRWMPKSVEVLKNDDSECVFNFGSCDPNQEVSTVPCGGCGALLHCNDPSLPGFIPAEAYEGKTKKELRAEICQRCLFLKEYDVSLGVNVLPSEYLKILSAVQEKEALAILMVDLLDFPCSIFPEILDVIGPTKPVVIVGNKVDMLIQEERNNLDYFKYALVKELKNQGISFKNVKHVCLISAKTGYGVENLIDQLHLNWGSKGCIYYSVTDACRRQYLSRDVYLIGCTNVGKSTLFNTLIQSDYCKVKAINLLQRATVSAWPGTTLNLLKFPIMKPTRSRLVARSLRLRYQQREEAAAQTFQWLGQNIKLEQIPLQAHVGKTFDTKSEPEENEALNDLKRGLDPEALDFKSGKWFYDTPGVVHQDQLVNLLTTSELLLTVPKKMLLPRNFHLKPGHSIFVAGLGRLDFISGPDFVWFTVFASMELPLTVTKLEDADYVYNKLLGTPFFRVPTQGKERLAKWPGLSSKKFEIVGKAVKFDLKDKYKKKMTEEATADIVLSSAGWIAVTVPTAYCCEIEVWTPEGKGIYIRECPIIKRGFTFRGAKIPQTPAFTVAMREVEGVSVTHEPPF